MIQPMKNKQILITSILVLSGVSVMATTYDMSTDWSDTLNPNGVWSFTEGASSYFKGAVNFVSSICSKNKLL